MLELHVKLCKKKSLSPIKSNASERSVKRAPNSFPFSIEFYSSLSFLVGNHD